MRLVQGAESTRGLLAGDAFENAVGRLDDSDLQPFLGGFGRRLQADIAAADDDQFPAGLELGHQAIGVVERAHDADIGQVAADFRRQAPGASAGRQQQGVITERLAIGQRDLTVLAVDRRRRRTKPQLNAVLVIPFARAKAQPVEAHRAGHVLLRQGRVLIGKLVLVGDYHDLHFGGMLAERRGRCDRSVASSDDNGSCHGLLSESQSLRDRLNSVVCLDCIHRGRRQLFFQPFAAAQKIDTTQGKLHKNRVQTADQRPKSQVFAVWHNPCFEICVQRRLGFRFREGCLVREVQAAGKRR